MTYRVTASRYVSLKTLVCGVVIFNTDAKPAQHIIFFTILNFNFNMNLNLFNATTAPYGPPFDTKCLLSVRVFTYET